MWNPSLRPNRLPPQRAESSLFGSFGVDLQRNGFGWRSLDDGRERPSGTGPTVAPAILWERKMTTQRTRTTIVLIAILAWALPTLADTRIEREFELSGGGRFVLDADNGSVEISGSSGSTVRIVVTSTHDDIESLYDFSFESSSGQVEVRADRKGSVSKWFGWTRGGGLHFDIQTPRNVELDIDTAGGRIEADSIDGDVRLDTSGGSIQVRGIKGDVLADTSGGSIVVEDVTGSVNADTSGGDITAEKVGGDLRADTSGGNIKVDGVDGNVKADTSGGSIRIGAAGGRVEADTSGGAITAALTRGNAGGGNLSTSGGGITVYLDPGANLDIDASSSGGSVVCDVPVTVRGRISKTSLQGKLGSGGPTLRMRTSGGGIRIKSL